MNEEIPKLIQGQPWVVNLREDQTPPITSERGSIKNLRFIVSTQNESDPTIFVVDENGTTARGLSDGTLREMIPDTDPCSCEEYRKQGIEEGWLDE